MIETYLPSILPAIYLLASIGFILAVKWLNHPDTARRGVIIGELGMLLAVIGTLLRVDTNFSMIFLGMAIGAAIGAPLAYLMPMTAVPQLTALSHAFGALASALIGTAEFYRIGPTGFTMAALSLETLLGFLTTTASIIAFAKLQELMPTRPLTYPGQNVVSLGVLAGAIVMAVMMVAGVSAPWMFPAFIGLALLFGILLVIPIGGADMPTVIALLNSYAGVAAAAMGFVLDNKLLIVAGSLNATAGLLLSIIMCKAMNRSFTNVLFGAFGQVQGGAAAQASQRPVRSATPEEAAAVLDAASSVIIIPGYGMAVAQAQHKVRELYDMLTKRGVDVRFAIHPVAGRMPGHMNVLLAEADIPYDKLFEMDEINGDFPNTDVALVIGANDVVNPLARSDQDSPIAGMPILDADKAHTVMVIKRSMSPGFAGIDNELYYMNKTLMLFGDAKAFTAAMVKELAGHGS
ncbi:MAG TPA: NAD(P)(+) transhydrogenase (Re/Si-specific) subunit beta [Bryobacteraceae bacterium]|nr:NAD(P)(+) transhydrogenase (Re/Si-specific) subunit beta [Bryobacteraceae bacterium]